MRIGQEGVRRRDQREIECGDGEVSLAEGGDLRVSAGIIERYLAPPADASFASEYAYNLLGDVRGKDVLDLGCGDGENTILLVNRGAKVCGIDISDTRIALARRRMEVNGIADGFEFFTGSAHELPFPDRSFDVIFGMATLYNFDLELASREIWRVLRPGGYAVFKEPVRNSRFHRLIRRLIPYYPSGVSTLKQPLTDLELERFVGRFSQCHCRAYQLPYVNVAG